MPRFKAIVEQLTQSECRLLLEDEPAAREAVWKAYRDAPIHDKLKEDFEANRVRYQKHVSPYKVKKVGQRPEAC